MPGIKSITITVEFMDGTAEVATVRHPREVTITNANDRGLWREEVPHRTAPLFSIELAVKDALEVDWRAYPDAAAAERIRYPSYPDKRGPDPAPFTGPGYEAHPGHDHEDCCK